MEGIREAGEIGRRGMYPEVVGGARRGKFHRAILREALRAEPGVIFGVHDVC